LDVRRIGESSTLDRLFDRHIARIKVDPGKRVPAHHEQVKNEDGQAETIMIVAAVDVPKRLPLKLGGGGDSGTPTKQR